MHTAGALATAVDVNNQSGGNGNKSQDLSLLFIIVLLLLVFRSLLAPLVTLLPAALVLVIAGPSSASSATHGLQVSGITQLLLIVLILGAGTDYGLFLVFRVREEMRAGLDPHDAVVVPLARVGESITSPPPPSSSPAHPAAGQLRALPRPRRSRSRSASPSMLVAGLTLLPALLAIFGRARFWPSRSEAGGERRGLWGRLARRVVQRPAAPSAVGVVLFGGLAFGVARLQAGGFGGASARRPAATRAGQRGARRALPAVERQPDQPRARFATPVWSDPHPLRGRHGLVRAGSSRPRRAARPERRRPLTPAQLAALHAELGRPSGAPAHCRRPGRHVSRRRLQRLPCDRRVHQRRRPDGPVRGAPARRGPVDAPRPSTPCRRIRDAVARSRRRRAPTQTASRARPRRSTT